MEEQEQHHHQSPSSQSIILSALSTFTHTQLSDLTHYFSAVNHRHHRRVFSLLSSQTLFSLTLHRLHSLSLHHKSLLVARHLLSTLAALTHFARDETILPPPSSATATKLRDLDAVLLLLLLCELRQHDPHALDAPTSRWRVLLINYVADGALRISGIGGGSNCEVMIKFIDLVSKCKNFVDAMSRGGGKDRKEVAASVAVVVALPSVEVSGGGGERECVICKEEMREGRDVCRLPCHHLFHWMCILPWLKKRNTCPCCRFQLPSDDVLDEIGRLWEVVAKMSGGSMKLTGVL